MTEYLLVGEAPAADESRLFLEIVLALKSVGHVPAGRKVSLVRDVAWLARRHPALLSFVERATHVNLLRQYPGPGRKGSDFPLREGREAAERLMSDGLVRGSSMVLLAGRRVSRSFKIREPSYFQPVMVHDGAEFVVVPHPSGVNRWWNEGQNTRTARLFLERLGMED